MEPHGPPLSVFPRRAWQAHTIKPLVLENSLCCLLYAIQRLNSWLQGKHFSSWTTPPHSAPSPFVSLFNRLNLRVWFRVRFAFSIEHYGPDKSIVTWVHHCSVMQSDLSALKCLSASSYAALSSPLPIPGDHGLTFFLQSPHDPFPEYCWNIQFAAYFRPASLCTMHLSFFYHLFNSFMVWWSRCVNIPALCLFT